MVGKYFGTRPPANPLQTNRRNPLRLGPNCIGLVMAQTIGKPYGTTLFRSVSTSRKQAFLTALRNGVQVVAGSSPASRSA